jgi:hypothetical protein
MSKLYVFGIGGTGSRVIKSLVMLLASGVKLDSKYSQVIPILIDPDTGNGDLNRTKEILALYQQIRNEVEEPNDFFGQKVGTINEIATNSTSTSPNFFQFKLSEVDDSKFGEYIGYDSLSSDYSKFQDDKSFVKLFYSGANLDSGLEVGFKGNPNMGSIVLNQFTESQDFKNFLTTFQQGDEIFIINSIFGGTGAAGFPLLLKVLRSSESVLIRQCKIGGLTLLPYFALAEKGEINSETFAEKAKAALEYYNRTIINGNEIDYLYFLGNKSSINIEEYSVGGVEQKNNAHFLEMAGSLAIIDFGLADSNARTGKTIVKEFGIEKDTDVIDFSSLNVNNLKQIDKPLVKFKLFTNYLNLGLNKALNVSRWTLSNIKGVSNNQQSLTDQNYFNSPKYNTQIISFNNFFDEWLQEMDKNTPSFSPFNEEVQLSNAMEFVKDRKPKGNLNFTKIDQENSKNVADPKYRSDKKVHTALIKLFGTATEKVVLSSDIVNK